MKVKIGKLVLLAVIIFTGLISCKKDQSMNTKQSDVVKRYLEFKTKMNANSNQALQDLTEQAQTLNLGY